MMRKLLVPAVLLLVTVSLSLVVGAQEKVREQGKAGANVVKGKVTQVNPSAKTVTISGQDGSRVSLDFANAKVGACKINPSAGARIASSFPKIGDSAVARANACSECLETC